MLWNEVYKFFVQYIFGGYLYNSGEIGSHYATLGGVYSLDDSSYYEIGTLDMQALTITWAEDGASSYMSLGNYLSLIATIITMVAILLFCVFIIKKIIAIIFRLFTGGSAF